jgi:hypothetical protein
MALDSSSNHDQSRDAPRPFSLRLSADQRRVLEVRAGRMPLGEYIRSQLFAGDAPRPPSRRPRPVKDHKALAEVLARLGASRLSSNMNQLARAANSGALPVTPETQAALRQACQDIAAMKALLMQALGFKGSADR